MTDIFIEFVKVFFKDRRELDKSVSAVLVIVFFSFFTQSRKETVICLEEIIKSDFEISCIGVLALHGLDCLDIILNSFFIESDTEHVLGSILELVSFVDNDQPARTQDVSCRSVWIFATLQCGEEHIVVGDLVIKVTALGFIHVSCVTAIISVLALSAGAFDTDLVFDRRTKVECIKVDQSFGIVQRFELLNRSLILLELGDLLVVFLISSLAEVMFLAFAEGYGQGSMDNAELLKHLREVWNFLFYDSSLKLYA